MIYLFHGTDKIKARGMAHKAVEAAQKKHAGAEYFKLTTDGFEMNKVDELTASQGLFYSGSIIFADSLFDDADIADLMMKKVKEISESPNFFVFLEGKLNKKELERFEKYAQKIEVFDLPEKKLSKKEALEARGEKIDFFEFTDAFGAKDKKNLWGMYQYAISEGVPAEEVHGILWWQVKAMLSAVKAQDSTEAGLNPFVYNKAKAYAKNFGASLPLCEAKLKEISTQFFNMYHQAHRGEADFAVAMERFILGL